MQDYCKTGTHRLAKIINTILNLNSTHRKLGRQKPHKRPNKFENDTYLREEGIRAGRECKRSQGGEGAQAPQERFNLKGHLIKSLGFGNPVTVPRNLKRIPEKGIRASRECERSRGEGAQAHQERFN